MNRLEVISKRTGRTEEQLRDECVLDHDYERHFPCDGDHCQECWELEDKRSVKDDI